MHYSNSLFSQGDDLPKCPTHRSSRLGPKVHCETFIMSLWLPLTSCEQLRLGSWVRTWLLYWLSLLLKFIMNIIPQLCERVTISMTAALLCVICMWLSLPQTLGPFSPVQSLQRPHCRVNSLRLCEQNGNQTKFWFGKIREPVRKNEWSWFLTSDKMWGEKGEVRKGKIRWKGERERRGGRRKGRNRFWKEDAVRKDGDRGIKEKMESTQTGRKQWSGQYLGF